MALPTKRNLGSLRQELRDRLGYASSGSQAGPGGSIMDSFLRQAQEQLYWEYIPREMVKSSIITTNDGQTLYDWPDNCNPDRLLRVNARDTSASSVNRWKLIEGIEYHHDDYATPKSRPLRYERRDQIEVWPQPDGNQYRIDLEYVKRLDPFSVDADFITLDADLVLMLALSNAKAHYRHQDANVYAQQLVQMLNRIKSGTQGGKRFVRGTRRNSGQSFTHYFNEHMQHYHTEDV
jgi:hypothetical protein